MITAAVLSVLLATLDTGKICWTVASSGVGSPTAEAIPIPRRTLVRIGQPIKISGSVQLSGEPPTEIDGVVYVRVGLDTRSQLAVTGKWSYEWNTTKEKAGPAKLTISYRTSNDGHATVIRTCDITFIDSDPLQMSPSPIDGGAASLKLVVGPGLAVDKARILVDGLEVGPSFDIDGVARLGRADLASSADEVSIQVVGPATKQGTNLGVVSTPAIRMKANQDLVIDPNEIVLTHPVDPFDTLVEIPFTTTVALKPDSAQVTLRSRVVRGKATATSFQLDPRDIDPRADAELILKAQDKDGRWLYARKATVDGYKLRDLRQRLEAQLRTERQRLRKIFELDLGDAFREDDKGKRTSLGTTFNGKIASNTGFGLPVEGLELWAPGSIVFTTQKVVHFFAPSNTTEGRAVIAKRFKDFWPDPIDGAKLTEEFQEHIGKLRWAQQFSFLGPHHKGQVKELEAAVLEWTKGLEEAEVARKLVIETKSYLDLAAFTAKLNAVEKSRLRANRALYDIESELGEDLRTITHTRWVVSPVSQNDIDYFKWRVDIEWPWWYLDPPAIFFPKEGP